MIEWARWTRASVVMGLVAMPACGGVSDPLVEPAAVDRCVEPAHGVNLGGVSGTGADSPAAPMRRLVLVGGGVDDDSASTLFVESAGGGDIVVLSASGALTEYPHYFTHTLEAKPNPASAVTLLISNPMSGDDPAVLCWMRRAEAVWLDGGSQWDYLGRWPSSLHAELAALAVRGATVGGTGAGAVSLGEAAFDEQFGTVVSRSALADPLAREISMSYPSFAQPELAGMLVDSHFFDLERQGRMLAFLARFIADRGHDTVVGVGLDEGVALVVENGSFHVSTEGKSAVWLYEVTGPVSLTEGSPLDLAAVRRVRLGNGSQGVWPLDFDEADTRALYVQGGFVRGGSPSTVVEAGPPG